MKIFITLGILLFTTLNTYASKELKTHICQACHPKIYKEYQSSMHAKASIYKNEIFRAVWEKHPLSKTNNFKCAKCHTPSDKKLISGETKLSKNSIQLHEPISCQYCHQIKSIEEHAKSNTNIQITQKKTIFARNIDKKGQMLEFKPQSSLTKMVGSPYHDINYSNENYYNGNMCLGCHSHKQNDHGFKVCDFEIKKGKSDFKENCITCHMPQVSGSFVNHKDTKTHAFHGATALIDKPFLLSKHVKLSLEKGNKNFVITVKNGSNHTLTPHPLRLSKLKVSLQREDKIIELKDVIFIKVIGKDGKPTMPWIADEIITDKTIKAFEKRELKFNKELKSGDIVTVRFGYHIVNPQIAKKLQLKEKRLSKFITLTRKIFKIQD